MKLKKKYSPQLYWFVIVSFITFCSPHYLSAQFCLQPPEGIVSWWDGDAVSESIAFDIEAGNDGFLKDGVFITPGLVGDAFSFDGIDGWVKIPASANLNIIGDLTIDFWAMRNSFGDNQQLMYKGLEGSDGIGVPTTLTMSFDLNNYLIAGFERSDGSGVYLKGFPVTDSEFHHYAYVREGDSHALYFDGEVIAAEPFSGFPGDTLAVHLVIGARRKETGVSFDFFDGIIDEIQICNRAISDQKISDIYLVNSEGQCKGATFSGFNRRNGSEE
ncbi:MAG: hypothetical protein SCALA701_11800 [Candidatus Scalindua sp.]|nr:MAG: hypothetical protein SCALA701_11800 [Candidatus Scalindua sp.]